MKKRHVIVLLLLVCILNASCATVFGGKVTSCQKEKHDRQIRPVALVLDILLCPIVCLPIDFATHAIYKPCATGHGSHSEKHSARPDNGHK